MISRRHCVAASALIGSNLRRVARDSRNPVQVAHHRQVLVEPPKAAVSAGYATPALIDHFDTDTTSESSPSGHNWYTFNPYGGPELTRGQYTVADGKLQILTDVSGYSFGLTTINSLTPTLSRPGAIAGNSGKGVIFQHGYFECRMRFNATLSPRTAKHQSWPAFWANGISGPQAQIDTYAELDFIEAYPVAAAPFVSVICTVHEWTRGWTPDRKPNGRNGNVQNSNNTVAAPYMFRPSDFNTYGCLWTPREVTWFLNGRLGPTVPVGPDTPYEAISAGAMYLVLGTGKNWPLVVDYVHVWQ
jgi:hypothetical protein